MYINFPRFDKNVPHMIRKVLQVMPDKNDGDQVQEFVAELLYK